MDYRNLFHKGDRIVLKNNPSSGGEIIDIFYDDGITYRVRWDSGEVLRYREDKLSLEKPKPVIPIDTNLLDWMETR